MKASLLLAMVLSGVQAFAGEHSLAAHEHGSVKLAIAVDKNSMDIDLDGPSDSFMGFEHAPKSAKETKLFNETKELWEKKLLTLITPAGELGCKISEASFNQVIEGSHAEVEAKAKVTCAKDLTGKEVQISLIKTFKKIKKLKVEVLSAETKSIEINKAVQPIKL